MPDYDLFELIKSLNGSEKRYFKMNTALQKGNKKYLKLFELMDSMKIYDDNNLKSKFGKDGDSGTLSFTKNYLQKLIFRSLISYNENKNPDSKIFDLLWRCRLLYGKALFGSYFRTLKTGKELSLKYERFSFLLEFIEMERQLSKKEDIARRSPDFLYREESNVLKKIKHINNLKKALARLFTIRRMDGLVRSTAQEKMIGAILDYCKNDSGKSITSLNSVNVYYFIKQIAAELKGDFNASHKFCRERYKLIKDNKIVFHNSIYDNLKDSLLNLISSAVSCGKYEEAFKYFSEYKKLHGSSEVDEINHSLAGYEIKTGKALSAEEIPDLRFLRGLEYFLIEHKDKINIITYNMLYFRLAQLYFLSGEFNNALKITNLLFDSKKHKLTPFIEPYTRMLNILIHFELENYKLVKFLIPATEKYLKSRKKYFYPESIILKAINRLSGNLSKDKFSDIIFNLKNEIAILSKDKYFKNLNYYFDYNKWIDNKLNNRK